MIIILTHVNLQATVGGTPTPTPSLTLTLATWMASSSPDKTSTTPVSTTLRASTSGSRTNVRHHGLQFDPNIFLANSRVSRPNQILENGLVGYQHLPNGPHRQQHDSPLHRPMVRRPTNVVLLPLLTGRKTVGTTSLAKSTTRTRRPSSTGNSTPSCSTRPRPRASSTTARKKTLGRKCPLAGSNVTSPDTWGGSGARRRRHGGKRTARTATVPTFSCAEGQWACLVICGESAKTDQVFFPSLPQLHEMVRR